MFETDQRSCVSSLTADKNFILLLFTESEQQVIDQSGNLNAVQVLNFDRGSIFRFF